MKVLHVITSLGDGGAEAVLYRMCKFDKSNHHIVVSLKNEQKYVAMLKKIGINVYTLNFSNSRINLRGAIKLYRLIKKIEPDVVQTWLDHADLVGGMIARLAGKKNIVWGVHHSELKRGESKLSTIFISRINALVSYLIPRRIIYCADESRKAQEKNGYKKSKGVTVFNGYDCRGFVPNNVFASSFRKELSIENDTFLIGHVGRYDPQKDLGNLIDAFSILYKKDLKFQASIVGTKLDTKNSNLVSSIKTNNLCNNVHLLGRRDDIESVMNGIDLFVLSSVSEAFPNVINEAMLCGTPCVATDVGDSSLIVGKTGWIVRPKDPIALADAIIKAYIEKSSNSSSWMQRKAACRKRIEDNFSIEKMIKNYEKVWSSSH